MRALFFQIAYDTTSLYSTETLCSLSFLYRTLLSQTRSGRSLHSRLCQTYQRDIFMNKKHTHISITIIHRKTRRKLDTPLQHQTHETNTPGNSI